MQAHYLCCNGQACVALGVQRSTHLVISSADTYRLHKGEVVRILQMDANAGSCVPSAYNVNKTKNFLRYDGFQQES